MITGFIIILALIVLSVLRGLHQSFYQRKFKYSVYELRDRLRFLKYKGELDNTEDWVFDYFDETLSKSIGESFYLTLYTVIALALRHSNRGELKEFEENIQQEISKNESLQSIQEAYGDAMSEYLAGQHYVTFHLLLKPILAAVIGASRLKEIINDTFIYPESSVSRKFQHDLK